MIRKILLLPLLLLLPIWLSQPPVAHADYFQYPCTYPFVGTSADVDVIAHGGGEYCDGPEEINGTHYHCMAGGGGIGGGAIGIAGNGPLSIGGFGGSGIGMNLADCHYVCPDNFLPTPERFPNPPAAWIKELHVKDSKNICFPDHMAPAGADSAPPSPAPEGAPPPAPPTPKPPKPGDDGSDSPLSPVPGPVQLP